MIARFKRWLRDRKTPVARPMTDWEILLLEGGRAYRAKRPYVYGVIGRRET